MLQTATSKTGRGGRWKILPRMMDMIDPSARPEPEPPRKKIGFNVKDAGMRYVVGRRI
jgi:hypothetical protein